MSSALREETYRDWLDSQGLRFGFAAEIAALAQRERAAVGNDTPTESLWPHILPTVRLVESVRERFGPTVIHSAYRAPLYNRAVGGETHSRHMENDAIDFSCATCTPHDWAVFLRGLRDAGVFSGGIGEYATFVHVDTRGHRADWKAASVAA